MARTERVAFLGLGIMGAPMAANLLRAGFDGTLTIMVGGSDRGFERALPVLEGMGELIVHVGPQGHGSMVKLINNTVAAVNAATLGEALVLAQAARVDVGRLRQVMAAGSGGSAMLALKAEPMLGHDFDPLFKLAHMLKDVRHCLEEAQRLGVAMPLAMTAERLYTQADRHGFGEQDFAAVITALQDSST